MVIQIKNPFDRFQLFFFFFKSKIPCQRQCELLPSLAVRRLLTFHILIFSSETAWPNEPKLVDDSYQVSVVAMFVNRSGRNEHSS
jgi:hypothetical protein